ncbi:MAG: TetR/AcrR family transcriptional regulator [Burkholderiales bacterium]|jgi:AcrR family transcriptional regulator|nr:TetR/AcrR family transcriptional regulator [Burkholderiales bacterium]
MVATERISLKEQQLRLKEAVILQAVNGLLAQKGYDLMTVDQVAAEVGIAKPSLYKLFDSKEALAGAAMVRLLGRALDVVHAQPADAPALLKLRALLRWAVEEQLRGEMPRLPSTRSSLRDALMRNDEYVRRLNELGEALSGWISAAQQAGDLAADLPVELVLFILFARTCDPVVDYLKLGGAFSDAEIVDLLERSTFAGLTGGPLAPLPGGR